MFDVIDEWCGGEWGLEHGTHLSVVAAGEGEEGDGTARCAVVADRCHMAVEHDRHCAQGLAWVWVGLARKLGA